MRWTMVAGIGLGLALVAPVDGGEAQGASPYAKWQNGPPQDPNWFPVGVWAQSPRNAARYREAGINMYVGQTLTEERLAALRQAGITVVCTQNEVGLAHKDDSTIIGWQQGDEPDIAKGVKFWERKMPGKTMAEITKEVWPDASPWEHKDLGPPIPPQWIQDTYAQWRKNDPTRPVFLNVTFGFFREYGARVFRKNHPGDYLEYLKGCDIICYDFYPGRGQNKAIDGKFWVVPEGVRRLHEMGKGEKIVWVCIEAMKPIKLHTPRTSKAQVWMSLIHGAQGIVYFVHQMGKDGEKFIEASVFEDAEMAKVFTETNQRVLALAPVLNRPTVAQGATVASSVPASEEVAKAKLDPIAAMVKKHNGDTYLFAIRMEDSPATGTFTVKGVNGATKVEVINENRTLEIKNGKFTDEFQGLQEHIYKIGK